MTFLKKLIFLIRRPVLVIVLGKGRACAAEAVFQVLKRSFGKVKFLILQEIPDRFFIKRAKKTVLLITTMGQIPADEVFFSGDKKDITEPLKLLKSLGKQDCLVLNADDETVRELRSETKIPVLSFGLSGGVDFQVSDIHVSQEGTNFKVNYQGNIVPVWLKNLFGKEQIYGALAALSAGLGLDINLVQVSQALKFYQSLPGHMRLIAGIKNTKILDDSANANPFSMTEALKILARIPCSGRRIAVLGDILGIGKWTMASHETIGQSAKECCDLLFTVGARAKFIAQGATSQGMAQDKVFQFMDTAEAGLALQRLIKPNDLILVDGSKEMDMPKIVAEIKETEKISR